MIRALTADFARRVVQAAIGEKLRAHYKASDELPSLLRSLIALIERQGAVGVPTVSERTPVETSAERERRATGDPPGTLKRKAAALLARAEEVRAAGDNMHDGGAREAMYRLAESYEKVARNIIKSADASPSSEIG